MKAFLLACLFAALCHCSAARRKAASSQLEIELFHNNKFEKRVKESLLGYEKNFDLTRFIFTNKIMIQSRSKPHSHPVLTLNTRNVNKPELSLSTFIHEQMHWFLAQDSKKAGVQSFIALMKEKFPQIPVGRTEGGARNVHSSYLHLAVNTLELDGMRHLFGDKKGMELFGQKKTYRGLNALVLKHYSFIQKALSERKLIIKKN